MIIAGIDEAGYGPVLGPLVVGCSAFRVPDSEQPQCVWKLLNSIFSKSRDRKGTKLHINDSKQVYSPSAGIKELEKSVLTLSAQANGHASNLQGLLAKIDLELCHATNGYCWYRENEQEKFPLLCQIDSIKISANALKIASEQSQTHCIHFTAHVLLEKQFNELVEKTRNKASASFSLVVRHIDRLMKTYSTERLFIFCDRQGGREHYGPLLRMMFEDWALEIISESPKRAEYELTMGAQRVRICFCEKAETIALPVAAASMLAKYLREALMHRFNQYWLKHRPELAPTAGYYNDGMRFLRDIQDLREQMQIDDFDLIRLR